MLYYTLSFIIGAIYGSFLNVVIYRLPENLSIIKPRSFCPKCKNNIPLYRNIPIFSYLFQNGKCNSCKLKISIQYPLVELTTAFIAVISTVLLPIPESIFFLLISGFLICISFIDYKFYIIPLSLLIAIIITIIPFITFYTNYMHHIYGMLIGLGYLSLIFIVTWIVTKKQPLGFGDLQLIFVLGLWLGPIKVLLTIFFAAISGIIYWIILSVKKGYSKDVKLPFGTFLSIVAIIIYLVPINI